MRGNLALAGAGRAVLHLVQDALGLLKIALVLALHHVELAAVRLRFVALPLEAYPLGDDELLVIAFRELHAFQLLAHGLVDFLHVRAVLRSATLAGEARGQDARAALRGVPRHGRKLAAFMEALAEHLARQGVEAAALGLPCASCGIAEKLRVHLLEVFQRHDDGELLAKLFWKEVVEIGASRLLAVLARHEPAAVERILEVPPHVVLVHDGFLPALLVPVTVDVTVLDETSGNGLVRQVQVNLPAVCVPPVAVEVGGDDLEVVVAVLVLNDGVGGREGARSASLEFLLNEAAQHVVLQVVGIRLRPRKLHCQVLLPRGIVVERVHRELEVGKRPRVEQFDDLARVPHVPRKAVGQPSDDAVRAWPLPHSGSR